MPKEPRQSQKKCVTYLRREVSPEERRYDISCGRNRYVTLPLAIDKYLPSKP